MLKKPFIRLGYPGPTNTALHESIIKPKKQLEQGNDVKNSANDAVGNDNSEVSDDYLTAGSVTDEVLRSDTDTVFIRADFKGGVTHYYAHLKNLIKGVENALNPNAVTFYSGFGGFDIFGALKSIFRKGTPSSVPPGINPLLRSVILEPIGGLFTGGAHLRVGKVNVVLNSNVKDVGVRAADEVAEQMQAEIKKKGKVVVCFATGSTMEGMYKVLRTKYKNKIDWSMVIEVKNDENEIKKAGGIDIMILEMDANGNILSVEPQIYFHSVEFSTIMGAKKVILLASGDNKREALINALYGPVVEDVPASILQKHPNVTFFVDQGAFGKSIPQDDVREVLANLYDARKLLGKAYNTNGWAKGGARYLAERKDAKQFFDVVKALREKLWEPDGWPEGLRKEASDFVNDIKTVDLVKAIEISVANAGTVKKSVSGGSGGNIDDEVWHAAPYDGSANAAIKTKDTAEVKKKDDSDATLEDIGGHFDITDFSTFVNQKSIYKLINELRTNLSESDRRMFDEDMLPWIAKESWVIKLPVEFKEILLKELIAMSKYKNRFFELGRLAMHMTILFSNELNKIKEIIFPDGVPDKLRNDFVKSLKDRFANKMAFSPNFLKAELQWGSFWVEAVNLFKEGGGKFNPKMAEDILAARFKTLWINKIRPLLDQLSPEHRNKLLLEIVDNLDQHKSDSKLYQYVQGIIKTHKNNTTTTLYGGIGGDYLIGAAGSVYKIFKHALFSNGSGGGGNEKEYKDFIADLVKDIHNRFTVMANASGNEAPVNDPPVELIQSYYLNSKGKMSPLSQLELGILYIFRLAIERELANMVLAGKTVPQKAETDFPGYKEYLKIDEAPSVKDVEAFIAEHIPKSQSPMTLVLGPGNDVVEINTSRRYGRVYVWEESPAHIKKIKERYKEGKSGVTLLTNETLKNYAGQFDIIRASFATHLFSHFLLKSGGILVFQSTSEKRRTAAEIEAEYPGFKVLKYHWGRPVYKTEYAQKLYNLGVETVILQKAGRTKDPKTTPDAAPQKVAEPAADYTVFFLNEYESLVTGAKNSNHKTYQLKLLQAVDAKDHRAALKFFILNKDGGHKWRAKLNNFVSRDVTSDDVVSEFIVVINDTFRSNFPELADLPAADSIDTELAAVWDNYKSGVISAGDTFELLSLASSSGAVESGISPDDVVHVGPLKIGNKEIVELQKKSLEKLLAVRKEKGNEAMANTEAFMGDLLAGKTPKQLPKLKTDMIYSVLETMSFEHVLNFLRSDYIPEMAKEQAAIIMLFNRSGETAKKLGSILALLDINSTTTASPKRIADEMRALFEEAFGLEKTARSEQIQEKLPSDITPLTLSEFTRPYTPGDKFDPKRSIAFFIHGEHLISLIAGRMRKFWHGMRYNQHAAREVMEDFGMIVNYIEDKGAPINIRTMIADMMLQISGSRPNVGVRIITALRDHKTNGAELEKEITDLYFYENPYAMAVIELARQKAERPDSIYILHKGEFSVLEVNAAWRNFLKNVLLNGIDEGKFILAVAGAINTVKADKTVYEGWFLKLSGLIPKFTQGDWAVLKEFSEYPNGKKLSGWLQDKIFPPVPDTALSFLTPLQKEQFVSTLNAAKEETKLMLEIVRAKNPLAAAVNDFHDLYVWEDLFGLGDGNQQRLGEALDKIAKMAEGGRPEADPYIIRNLIRHSLGDTSSIRSLLLLAIIPPGKQAKLTEILLNAKAIMDLGNIEGDLLGKLIKAAGWASVGKTRGTAAELSTIKKLLKDGYDVKIIPTDEELEAARPDILAAKDGLQTVIEVKSILRQMPGETAYLDNIKLRLGSALHQLKSFIGYNKNIGRIVHLYLVGDGINSVPTLAGEQAKVWMQKDGAEIDEIILVPVDTSYGKWVEGEPKSISTKASTFDAEPTNNTPTGGTSPVNGDDDLMLAAPYNGYTPKTEAKAKPSVTEDGSDITLPDITGHSIVDTTYKKPGLSTSSKTNGLNADTEYHLFSPADDGWRLKKLPTLEEFKEQPLFYKDRDVLYKRETAYKYLADRLEEYLEDVETADKREGLVDYLRKKSSDPKFPNDDQMMVIVKKLFTPLEVISLFEDVLKNIKKGMDKDDVAERVQKFILEISGLGRVINAYVSDYNRWTNIPARTLLDKLETLADAFWAFCDLYNGVGSIDPLIIPLLRKRMMALGDANLHRLTDLIKKDGRPQMDGIREFFKRTGFVPDNLPAPLISIKWNEKIVSEFYSHIKSITNDSWSFENWQNLSDILFLYELKQITESNDAGKEIVKYLGITRENASEILDKLADVAALMNIIRIAFSDSSFELYTGIWIYTRRKLLETDKESLEAIKKEWIATSDPERLQDSLGLIGIYIDKPGGGGPKLMHSAGDHLWPALKEIYDLALPKFAKLGFFNNGGGGKTDLNVNKPSAIMEKVDKLCDRMLGLKMPRDAEKIREAAKEYIEIVKGIERPKTEEEADELSRIIFMAGLRFNDALDTPESGLFRDTIAKSKGEAALLAISYVTSIMKAAGTIRRVKKGLIRLIEDEKTGKFVVNWEKSGRPQDIDEIARKLGPRQYVYFLLNLRREFEPYNPADVIWGAYKDLHNGEVDLTKMTSLTNKWNKLDPEVRYFLAGVWDTNHLLGWAHALRLLKLNGHDDITGPINKHDQNDADALAVYADELMQEGQPFYEKYWQDKDVMIAALRELPGKVVTDLRKLAFYDNNHDLDLLGRLLLAIRIIQRHSKNRQVISG